MRLARAGTAVTRDASVMRIRSTLELEHLWASEALLPELSVLPEVEVSGEPAGMDFDVEGNLTMSVLAVRMMTGRLTDVALARDSSTLTEVQGSRARGVQLKTPPFSSTGRRTLARSFAVEDTAGGRVAGRLGLRLDHA